LNFLKVVSSGSTQSNLVKFQLGLTCSNFCKDWLGPNLVGPTRSIFNWGQLRQIWPKFSQGWLSQIRSNFSQGKFGRIRPEFG